MRIVVETRWQAGVKLRTLTILYGVNVVGNSIEAGFGIAFDPADARAGGIVGFNASPSCTSGFQSR